MTRDAELHLGTELIQAMRDLARQGINQGRSGNASARLGAGFLITPSGVSYDQMKPPDLVRMELDGSHERSKRPSSEWRFHRDILRARPDVHAVVHTHSIFATAVACHGRDIPAFHYMVAAAGGDSIRCAPYAPFGSQALSDGALQALLGRSACLLANHGVIATGGSVERAVELASEVETLAAMYCRALALGAPRVLSEEEMQTVLHQFEGYFRTMR